MNRTRPSVLVVSPSEQGGGAEMIAAGLFNACRQTGLQMQMAVGQKVTSDPDVFEIPNDRYRSTWARTWLRIATILGWNRLRNIGEPLRWFSRFRGREDMRFPGSAHLLDAVRSPVNLIHCHNLHGIGSGFFDLRALPDLGRRLPVLLTLHDAWLFAGHCAHSFDCDRWLNGCGRCPDLTIPEKIRRDGSAANFALKLSVFERCFLHIASPSQWLLDRALRSVLAPAIKDAHVIPNGVDLECFFPGDRNVARRRLGLDEDARVILTVGNTLKHNIWRDFSTATEAVRSAARTDSKPTLFLGLGDSNDRHTEGNLVFDCRSHRNDPREVATFFQAADIFLHSSRVDTFPGVVLEAMACGLPVVASAVGGIPEQIVDGKTGFLVEPGNVEVMARRINNLFSDPELRQRLGEAAASRAKRRFDHQMMVNRYLDWYWELVS